MYWLVVGSKRICCVDGFPAAPLNKFVRDYPQFEVIAL
jgi:hypothetical protein